MGAGNVGRVYMAWAATLKPRSFQLLTYMALMSRDHDADPWFGLGHEELARKAFGWTLPDDDAKREFMLRRVRRHITPLFAVGAIETRERATYGHLGKSHVVYRLYLDGPYTRSPFPSSSGSPAPRPPAS